MDTLSIPPGLSPKDPSFPQQIHLSITKNAREMVVVWVTFEATDSDLRFIGEKSALPIDDSDSDSGHEGFTVPTASTEDYTYVKGASVYHEIENLSGLWKAYVHTVTMKELRLNSKYSYSVGQRKTETWSETYEFRTRNIIGQPVTLVTFADFSTLNEVVKNRTTMARLHQNLSEFDMIIEFGDLCYANGDCKVWDLFFNHIQPIAACKPWMPTVGNHENENDYFDGMGFKNYEARFKLPGRYHFWYSFDYGYAHIVVISTEHPIAPGTPQHEWLIRTLTRANKKREEIPWIIITGHRGLYGSNTRWFYKPKAINLRTILCPILDQFHVDLALFGHVHAYERTHPIFDGDINAKGTVYLLAGVAGADLNKEFHPQPQWSAYRTAHHGYGLLHVQSPKKLRFCYHRERDGKMWDAFTITKHRDHQKEISYDYENKWLKNWQDVPVEEARAIRMADKARKAGYPGQCKMGPADHPPPVLQAAEGCTSSEGEDLALLPHLIH